MAITKNYTTDGLLEAPASMPGVTYGSLDGMEAFSYNADGTAASEQLWSDPQVHQPTWLGYSSWALFDWAATGMGNIGLGGAISPMSVSLTYNADQQVSQVYRYDESANSSLNNAWSSGPTTAYAYDAAGRISSEITSYGGSNLVSYSWSSYDTDDQPHNETFSDSGSTAATFALTYMPDDQPAAVGAVLSKPI